MSLKISVHLRHTLQNVLIGTGALEWEINKINMLQL
jgi:hypothetical protein